MPAPKHKFISIVSEVVTNPSSYVGQPPGILSRSAELIRDNLGFLITLVGLGSMVATVEWARRKKTPGSMWWAGLFLVGAGVLGSVFVYLLGNPKDEQQYGTANTFLLIVAGIGANLIASVPTLSAPSTSPALKSGAMEPGEQFFAVLGVYAFVFGLALLAAIALKIFL